jgi:hypothetical protein
MDLNRIGGQTPIFIHPLDPQSGLLAHAFGALHSNAHQLRASRKAGHNADVLPDIISADRCTPEAPSVQRLLMKMRADKFGRRRF